MWEEISAHIYRNYIITKRWPGELANIFVYPLIGLLSVGIFAFFMTMQGAPASSLVFVFVGVVAWEFFNTSLRVMGYGVAEDIWNNCMKHTHIGSSRTPHFMAGHGIWGAMAAMTDLALVTGLGYLIFGINVYQAGFVMLPALAGLFLFGIGTGMLVNSLIITKGTKTMALLWIVPGIVMVFSGVYYPAQIMPAPFSYLTTVLPSTYLISALRSAILTGGFLWSEIALGLAVSVAIFVLGIFVMNKAILRGKENGVLSKF